MAVNGFIDIHSHILPGLDDGPASIYQCIETARRYLALGTDCIIATPHWIEASAWTPRPERVNTAAQEVSAALARAGVPLAILPGMEIAFSDQFLKNFLASRLLPLGSSEYFLVEFPFTSVGANPVQDVLSQTNITPPIKLILAHPERCEAFQDNGIRLQQLVNNGVLVQLNIDSILGNYGPRHQELSFRFLRMGLVHFLATDSHARKNRLPLSPEQWQKLEALLGPDAVAMACRVNPQRLLAREVVPPVAVLPEKIDKYFSEHACPQQSRIKSLMHGAGLAKKFMRFIKKEI